MGTCVPAAKTPHMPGDTAAARQFGGRSQEAHEIRWRWGTAQRFGVRLESSRLAALLAACGALVPVVPDLPVLLAAVLLLAVSATSGPRTDRPEPPGRPPVPGMLSSRKLLVEGAAAFASLRLAAGRPLTANFPG